MRVNEQSYSVGKGLISRTLTVDPPHEKRSLAVLLILLIQRYALQCAKLAMLYMREAGNTGNWQTPGPG